MARSSVSPIASPSVFVLDDPRAEGGTRRVTVSAERVEIERRCNSIAMRLVLPPKAYAGVCLALRTGITGRCYYELKLVHRDPDLTVLLAEALDDRDIRIRWQAWAAQLGVPALVERSGGVELYREAAWSPEEVAAGAVHHRRAKSRRAPFVRRHQNQPPAPAVIHRGAEIIARS